MTSHVPPVASTVIVCTSFVYTFRRPPKITIVGALLAGSIKLAAAVWPYNSVTRVPTWARPVAVIVFHAPVARLRMWTSTSTSAYLF